MGLTIMILGLALFIGVHVFTTARAQRAALIKRIGEPAYKIGYAFLSLIGVVLIGYGFARYRATGWIDVWYPPAWTRHVAIAFRMPSTGRNRPWQFARRGGEMVEVNPMSRVRINDGQGIVVALCEGMGICQLPGYMVAEELASGRLVELLPGLRPPALPISLVYPSARLVPARVRVALESLGAMADAGSRL